MLLVEGQLILPLLPIALKWCMLIADNIHRHTIRRLTITLQVNPIRSNKAEECESIC